MRSLRSISSLTEEEELQFHREMVAKIIAAEEKRRLAAPVRVTFAMRMPVKTHQDLTKASIRQDITMTDIVLLAIDRLVPELMAAPPRSWKPPKRA